MRFQHKNKKVQIKREFEEQFGNIKGFEDGLEYEERINKQYENVYKKRGSNRTK